MQLQFTLELFHTLLRSFPSLMSLHRGTLFSPVRAGPRGRAPHSRWRHTELGQKPKTPGLGLPAALLNAEGTTGEELLKRLQDVPASRSGFCPARACFSPGQPRLQGDTSEAAGSAPAAEYDGGPWPPVLQLFTPNQHLDRSQNSPVLPAHLPRECTRPSWQHSRPQRQ